MRKMLKDFNESTKGMLLQMETSHKLGQRYVKLLEESNRKLDEKVLELSIFNDIARAFSSQAFDERNISIFLYRVLRRKIPLRLLAMLLFEEVQACLILASDQSIPQFLKNEVGLKMMREKNGVFQPPVDFSKFDMIEILSEPIPSSVFAESKWDVESLMTIPLIVEDKVVGLLGMLFNGNRSPRTDEKNFLAIVAAQVALFVENDRIKQAIMNERNKLEAANRELEAFSYSVSHDLRAPLRTINGFSLALLEDCGDHIDETGKNYLERIRTATQHMGELIDDMLELSRLSRREMHHEAVRLSEVAKELMSEIQMADPRRQVVFIVAEDIEVQGDPRLLRALLDNLLRNAWKFTSKHKQARIEFGRFEKEGKMVYFVRDDGAGFDMAYAGKLFGAFQRLHSSHEFEGSGIGLATVQRIVHRHGGRVWAEGEMEKGAAFYFTL